MAEEEVREKERGLEHLYGHGMRVDEEGLDHEEDEDDKNDPFPRLVDDGWEYDETYDSSYYSDAYADYDDSVDEAPTRVAYKPLDYRVLPYEIWRKILKWLFFKDRCNMAKIAMICPFFYKLIGVDFKHFCREFNVFKRQGETYACAFNFITVRTRWMDYYPCNYKVGFHWPERRVITVMSLDMDDTNTTLISTKGKVENGKRVYPFMYYGGTRLWFRSNAGIHYHDAQTGALLAFLDRHSLDTRDHYSAYRMRDTAVLFNGISLEFREVAIPEEAWLSSAGYSDQHDYCVFGTEDEIIVYDSKTNTRLEIAASYDDEDRKIKVLAASNSLIDGDEYSFCIYNIQTGDLLLEYNGMPRVKDEEEYRPLFLVINDFIVVEKGEKQIFFYDKEDETWKSSKEASPRVQQQLYREVFGSTFMAKSIWFIRTDFATYGLDERPGLRKIIEKRLKGITEYPENS